ncbi:MAG TPA: hypothetical protein VFJ19_14400 [Nocardioidaceae bacterium]|nr:hypothetical protein [Nocardioidaceae bacterium]
MAVRSVRVPTRALIATLLALIATLVLASCGRYYGGHASPPTGTSNRETPVKVVNTVVVVDGSGYGTVAATVVNQSTKPDRIVDVGLDTDETHVPVALFHSVALPVRQKVRLAKTHAIRVNAYHVKAGEVVLLSIGFAHNESLKFHVPVEKNTGRYAHVTIPARH